MWEKEAWQNVVLMKVPPNEMYYIYDIPQSRRQRMPGESETPGESSHPGDSPLCRFVLERGVGLDPKKTF